MEWLTPQRYAAELETETARFAAAATRRDEGEKVEKCPEWTVRDLVTHVGTGHRLAAGIIEERRDSPAEYKLVDAPDDQDDWAAWLTAGAQRLNAAVAGHGFDGEVWTWQPKFQTAGFWQRRMLHDLIVHRFDADPAGELAPDLAADGIADLMLAFEYFGKLTGNGETLLFTAADTGQSWHVTLTATGPEWITEDRAADVTCEAPVKDLLLILNRRRDPVAVAGDTTIYDRWRANSEF
ncbi:maleylpyruvate isomerase family mycothiol-dependent enzyme [Actinoplanes sp. CA-142083]|uniref:maleylpyruvate isomerase family mycothiol-dependent enzyme n=1 Tax=Actinoplanes sp. CA-142083 TaxID=3239903 RepID=UPI003D94A63E